MNLNHDQNGGNGVQDSLKRILVVDDEEVVLDVLSYLLDNSGYDVTVFSHPNEAMYDMKQQRFKLLITDLVMPDVNGFELIEYASAVTPDCKAIIITGNPSVEAATRARTLGVTDFIAKPFTSDEIVNAVQKAVSG